MGKKKSKLRSTSEAVGPHAQPRSPSWMPLSEDESDERCSSSAPTDVSYDPSLLGDLFF